MESTTSAYPAYPDYPARFTFDPPEHVSRWRPFVNWLLVIPHLLVLWALQTVSEVLSIISWFAILFTGKNLDGIERYQAMYMRYSARTGMFWGFLREEYPPFSFEMTNADPGDDPRVRLEVDSDLENRNRLTTAFRLILAIPQLLFAILISIGLFFVVLAAAFVVLFTGRWNDGMRDFAVGATRYFTRLNAYLLLLTDRYPPFSID
jgi:hypothetical protein